MTHFGKNLRKSVYSVVGVPLVGLLALGALADAGLQAIEPAAGEAKGVPADLESANSRRAAEVYLESRASEPQLRQFMQAFPKGGDLHNHLSGAIYAENWLRWAAEDGLCADMSVPRLVIPAANESCSDSNYITAEEAFQSDDDRRQLIDGMSMRSFVPTSGWSGHDQFFETFFRMASKPQRLSSMLTTTSDRAGHQNILYLEVMESLMLSEVPGLVAGVTMTGDPATDYQAIMNSPFGKQYDTLLATMKQQVDDAFAQREANLQCGTKEAQPGCRVKVRLLHQVIRSMDPASVYAQFILGWGAMAQIEQIVGINLVAPEDGFVALRDYGQHMAMIDYLYTTQGAQNVALHAGELTLGLVRPRELRSHMWQAIRKGHAKRIGHGIDVAYENESQKLLDYMRDNEIMVEINLTSNDVILGVEGDTHPLWLYRENEVPYAFSTDDEGVSRIDLTHEYMRGAVTFDLPYFELKRGSRNSLTYSFLPGESLWDIPSCMKDLKAESAKQSSACAEAIKASEKAFKQYELEIAFREFEAGLKLQRDQRRLFN